MQTSGDEDSNGRAQAHEQQLRYLAQRSLFCKALGPKGDCPTKTRAAPSPTPEASLMTSTGCCKDGEASTGAVFGLLQMCITLLSPGIVCAILSQSLQ